MKHRRPWVAPLGVGLSGILPPQGRKGRKPPASSAEVASPPPAEGIPASPREPGGPVDSAAFAVAVPAQPAQSPGPSKQPVLETPQSTSVISLLKQKSNASSEPSPTPEVEAVDTNEAQPLLQVVSHENETGAAPERQAEGDHACGSGKETPERPQTGAQPGHKERTGTSARKRAGKNRAEPGSGRQPKRAKSSQDGHLPDIQDLLHKVIEVPFSVFKQPEDKYYIGTVLRRDDKRPDSVTMKFEGDKRLYWFPVIEVRGWLEDMRHRRVVMPSAMEAKKDKGTAREESCPAPEDGLGTEEAASVLAELSAAGDSAAAGL